MGTRSTVKFYSEWNQKPIVAIYQQLDGYIEGVGHTLARFLEPFTVINGIGTKQDIIGKFANGMGCLAAQYIAYEKDSVGGFYVTNIDDEQEYNYEVRLIDSKIQITVDDFVGSPAELLEYQPT